MVLMPHHRMDAAGTIELDFDSPEPLASPTAVSDAVGHIELDHDSFVPTASPTAAASASDLQSPGRASRAPASSGRKRAAPADGSPSPNARKRKAGGPHAVQTAAEQGLFRQLVISHTAKFGRGTGRFKSNDWEAICQQFNQEAEQQVLSSTQQVCT